MNETHKELISIGLSLGIVLLTLFIIQHFIPSLIWAGTITIATYPLYRQWCRLFGKHDNLAALTFTLLLALLFFAPLSWLVTLLVKELQIFFSYLQEINRHGGKPPLFFQDIPLVGNELIKYWNLNIGEPNHLKHLLSNLHISLTPASHYIKQIGFNLAHRSVQTGFTVLTLFFFYRDAHLLIKQIDRVGFTCLGERWYRYADKLPTALRSTVNGTIVVGLGIGVLMGLCYALLHFPAPTLTGFITALAAMIPFVVSIVFGTVALIFFAQGSIWPAIIVIVWGTIVMFFADHFIKPTLIGGAIQLPFLAVLFGILGGVETLGLLGLFIGPIIMVFFITFWQELPNKTTQKMKHEA